MKRRKLLTALSLLLVAAFAFLLVSCNGNEGETPETKPSVDTTDSADEGNTDGKQPGDLTIGFNNLLKGHYSLDILEKAFVDTADAIGVKTMIVNDQGAIENVTENIDSMIAAGVDGLVIFGPDESMYSVISQKCEAAKVAFVFYDHMPSEENMVMLRENPYFKGAVGTRDLNTGRNIGEHAASLDLKNAIILTGAIADPTHNARTEGFTSAFESAGGKVLDVGWDALEGQDAINAANDLLTAHPEVDTIYASNGNGGSIVVEVVDQRGADVSIFVTDLDPDVLVGLQNGKIAAANGAHWINPNFALTLITNALLGHELTDSNGQAPELVVPVMTLPSELVDFYDEFWIQSTPYSDEEMQQFVVTWNDDVNFADFEQAMADYTIESRLKAKHDDGLISDEEWGSLGLE